MKRTDKASINVIMDSDIVEMIDKAKKAEGHGTRSAFVRTAAMEILKRLGYLPGVADRIERVGPSGERAQNASEPDGH